MHTINDTSQSVSHLLNLPPELRHHIFYLSLLPSGASQPASIETASRTYLSLQLTSHLVSNETHLLPFQYLPLALPCNFRTNATALLQSLRKMTKQQVHAIRTAQVSVLGSGYDGEEAARVVRMLRYGTEDSRERWNGIGVSPDVAVVLGEGRWWGEEVKVEEVKEDDWGRNYCSSFDRGSGLRELSLTVTARDVVAPMADSAAGMAKMLELETSPFFVELAQGVADGKFQRLRRVNVNVELGPSLKGAYLEEDVWQWEHDLWSKLNLVSKHSGTASSNSDGKAGQNDGALQARMGVKVQATFKSSPLTPAAACFTSLGGDESWWTGNTSATGGWSGTASATWGGAAVAMMSSSAPAGRPSSLP